MTINNNLMAKSGEVVGFAVSLFSFSFLLHAIFGFFGKITEDWRYAYTVLLVIVVLTFSYLIKKIVK